MHAFPTIQNKIQVEYDDNDLSIGKNFDTFSEAIRKVAYEKGITGAQAVKRQAGYFS